MSEDDDLPALLTNGDDDLPTLLKYLQDFHTATVRPRPLSHGTCIWLKRGEWRQGRWSCGPERWLYQEDKPVGVDGLSVWWEVDPAPELFMWRYAPEKEPAT